MYQISMWIAATMSGDQSGSFEWLIKQSLASCVLLTLHVHKSAYGAKVKVLTFLHKTHFMSQNVTFCHVTWPTMSRNMEGISSQLLTFLGRFYVYNLAMKTKWHHGSIGTEFGSSGINRQWYSYFVFWKSWPLILSQTVAIVTDFCGVCNPSHKACCYNALK